MRAIVCHGLPLGRFPERECPGAITLVTGWLPNAFRTLTPDDGDIYRDFLEARRLEATWDHATYVAFWKQGLRLWPGLAGHPDQAAARGLYTLFRRQHGESDDEIAAALGIQPETLTRRGVSAWAASAQDWMTTTPVASRRRVRAPLIVAEADDRPHHLELWYDPRLRNYDLPQSRVLTEQVMRAGERRARLLQRAERR